jgi:hypothetical protein
VSPRARGAAPNRTRRGRPSRPARRRRTARSKRQRRGRNASTANATIASSTGDATAPDDTPRNVRCAPRPAPAREATRALRAATSAHLGDVVLAFGCSRGDAAALRILERDSFHPGHESLLPPRHRADAPEVLQLLRHRLLVPDEDGRVRIGEYSGRGALRAWLRVAAVRVALNLHAPLARAREAAGRGPRARQPTCVRAPSSGCRRQTARMGMDRPRPTTGGHLRGS